MPAFDEIQLPKIKFRDAYFYDPSYMAWHKLDNHDDLFGMYVHTFRTFVPPERYFDNHPEYFSKVKSGRIPDGQLCLTKNDVFEIILGELGARMAARPGQVLLVGFPERHFFAVRMRFMQEHQRRGRLSLRFAG